MNVVISQNVRKQLDRINKFAVAVTVVGLTAMLSMSLVGCAEDDDGGQCTPGMDCADDIGTCTVDGSCSDGVARSSCSGTFVYGVMCSGGTLGDPLGYGGQTYRTVIIGAQTWMAENLNYETSNSWCYGGIAANCDKYGRLYTWNAAQTACPAGWHLPSDGEWHILMTAVGGSGMGGRKLKSTSGWPSGGNGTDEFGFSALPGGYRILDGAFYNAGDYGYWWSATEEGAAEALIRNMYYFNDYVDSYGDFKDNSFSVRCVRD